MKQLLRGLSGWEIDKHRNGHYRLTHIKSGERVTMAATPSDGRSVRNARAKLKRVERLAVKEVS